METSLIYELTILASSKGKLRENNGQVNSQNELSNANVAESSDYIIKFLAKVLNALMGF